MPLLGLYANRTPDIGLSVTFALIAADQVFDLDPSKTDISFSVPSTLHTASKVPRRASGHRDRGAITFQAGQNIVCTFSNLLPTGQITVAKQNLPGLSVAV
jgi:hypothetical protein